MLEQKTNRLLIPVPKNFWRPFEFFVTITANGTENFKKAIKSQGIDRSG